MSGLLIFTPRPAISESPWIWPAQWPILWKGQRLTGIGGRLEGGKGTVFKSGSDRRRVVSPTDMKDEAIYLNIYELSSFCPDCKDTHLGANYHH